MDGGKERGMDEQMDGWMSNRQERKKEREGRSVIPSWKEKNQWGQHGDSYLTKAFISTIPNQSQSNT